MIDASSPLVSTDVRAAAPATAVARTGAKRFVALDLLRFAAVLLMVQGHAFHILIEESVRPEKWHRWHSYVHGHTAPMFMMASGLAFGITTFRAWDAHGRLGPAVWKRIERYVLLIGLGYFLHLPAWSLRALFHAPNEKVLAFLEADALQVIGGTLLVAELLLLAVRNRALYVVLVGALGAVAVLLAPWASTLAAEDHLPRTLAAYVNTHGGSTFPLLPWAGFLAAGIVAAHFIGDALDRGRRAALAPHLAAWGGGLLLASLLVGRLAPDLFGEHAFWKASPLLAAWRIGVVLLALGLLCHLEPWLGRRIEHAGRGLRFVQTIAMETLVVYVAHLIVLYGSPVHTGLNRSIGPTLSAAESGLFVAVLLAVMALLAVAWHAAKKTWPHGFRVAQLALVAVAVLYALVAPG